MVWCGGMVRIRMGQIEAEKNRAFEAVERLEAQVAQLQPKQLG